jgi:undecaprenyl-diphosphatase
MSLLQACLLGIVQGITEFLPVSSSAHLVLMPWALGWRIDPQAVFIFDILVQEGTLVAVVLYFWRDLVSLFRRAVVGLVRRQPFEDPQARLAWLLVVASLPAALLGILLKDIVETAFHSPMVVSGFLLGTAAILLVSERLGTRHREMMSLSVRDAAWIGAAQAMALFPGISRSGATIAAGLVRGLRRPDAARFSFLLSVPVMLGAGLVALTDLARAPDALARTPALLAGFAAAAVSGFLAIRWLLSFLARRPLTVFAVYCGVVGFVGLTLGILRG